MKMNFENLLNNKKIEKIERDERDFAKVDEDIKSAEDNLKLKNLDWVMSISYQAVLRASINLMSNLGFRAIGKEHHKNTFEFLRECKLDEDMVDFFDKIRIKRNNFLYKDMEEISEKEASEILIKAKEFVQEIRTFVLKNRTGVKNE
jgi:uncharacterized protein (UPF0332 family)